MVWLLQVGSTNILSNAFYNMQLFMTPITELPSKLKTLLRVFNCFLKMLFFSRLLEVQPYFWLILVFWLQRLVEAWLVILTLELRGNTLLHFITSIIILSNCTNSRKREQKMTFFSVSLMQRHRCAKLNVNSHVLL